MKEKFLSIRVLVGMALIGGLAACGGGTTTDNVNLGGTITTTADFPPGSSVTFTDTSTTSTMTTTVPLVPGMTDSPFSFPLRIPVDAAYDITAVTSTPADTTCTVTNGAGTSGTADISASVSCVPNFSLSGSVVGTIPAGGLTLVNANDSITLQPGGPNTFTFPTKIGENMNYGVTSAQSNCIVSGGTGTMGTANVNTVRVTCT